MPLSKTATRQMNEAASNIRHFCKWIIGINLHPYQRLAAEEIIKSISSKANSNPNKFRKLAQRLFERLWWYDQVLFDTSHKGAPS